MRLATLGFAFVLACGASVPQPLALVAAPGSKLPAELVGEFHCRSANYRSRLSIHADGRYREVEVLWRRDDQWMPTVRGAEPCDPLGWASYREGALTLDSRPASCKELEDPMTVPMTRRSWRILRADADGFGDGEIHCARVR